MKNHFHSPIPALAALTIVIASMVAACSTTRRLPPDEILYTGVKKIAIDYPDSDTVGPAPGLAGDVKDAVNVAPNNSLISPYIRYPFPLGLWVYNNWDDPAMASNTGSTKSWWQSRCSYPMYAPRCAPR